MFLGIFLEFIISKNRPLGDFKQKEETRESLRKKCFRLG